MYLDYKLVNAPSSHKHKHIITNCTFMIFYQMDISSYTHINEVIFLNKSQKYLSRDQQNFMHIYRTYLKSIRSKY